MIKTVCGGLCKIHILVNLTLFVKLSGFALNLSGSDSSAKKKKKFIRRVYKISFFCDKTLISTITMRVYKETVSVFKIMNSIDNEIKNINKHHTNKSLLIT